LISLNEQKATEFRKAGKYNGGKVIKENTGLSIALEESA
jgi:hypothetical protein